MFYKGGVRFLCLNLDYKKGKIKDKKIREKRAMKIVKILFDGCYTDKGERIEHDAKTWGIFEAGLRGLGILGMEII